MLKVKMFYDKDKETRWLNTMMARGYAMTGYFFIFYMFDKTEPGKYTYQIDYLSRPFSPPESYREFMDSLHVEIVKTWFFWAYLRKPASEGAFELYTDAESLVAHYEKILKFFQTIAIIEAICLAIQLLCIFVGNVFWAAFSILFLGIILGILIVTMQDLKRKISNLREELD